VLEVIEVKVYTLKFPAGLYEVGFVMLVIFMVKGVAEAIVTVDGKVT
jgi:hypothetical protein